MNGFGFRKNTIFEWSGVQFRIERLHENGDVVLERVQDGAISVQKRRALLNDYCAGKISAAKKPVVDTEKSVEVFSRPLDELSEAMQFETARRRHYLEFIVARGRMNFTKKHLAPLISLAATEIGDAHPPGTSTVYRWYRRFRKNNDTRALIPRLDRRGSRLMKQDDAILQLAMDAIGEAYRASPMASGPGIHARLLAKIALENQYRVPKEQLKAPSLRTIYRILMRVDAYDRAVLREGKAAADKQFALVKAGARSEQILERVEIDHTPLDLFLIDEKSRLPLGRPTLTVVIDHYSRMLLGFHLSFGTPSTAAVMGALRHAILPKQSTTSTLNQQLKPQHDWSCHGIPDVMVVDNGMEFHGKDLESVAFDLGIRIQFCPKRQPRFKGVVERYLGTCNRFFAHQLPGTSLSRWHLRGDYDPLKHAVLTLSEFQQLFHKWVLDVYAQTIHRGTGETPWARWHEGLKRREPELPESPAAFKRRIGQIEERTLRADGIQLHGIRYNGDQLAPMLRTFGPGTKVRVSFDPEDLGEIYVWGPNDTEPVTVLALDQGYASGLTALQNELIRTAVREKGASQQNPVALSDAKQEIVRTVENLMSSKKQRDRRRAGEILGSSTSKSAAMAASPLRQKFEGTVPDTNADRARPTKFAQIDAPPPAYALRKINRKPQEESSK